MTKKGTTLKCVLLDANIIIEAYKLGIWEELIERVEFTVSSIVANDEVLFFSKQENKIPTPINLRSLIEEGKINELSATQEEMTSFMEIFDSVFAQGLDPGELESLSLIETGKAGDSMFCTSDAPAIKALAMMGRSDAGISMDMGTITTAYTSIKFAKESISGLLDAKIESAAKEKVNEALDKLGAVQDKANL